MLITSSDRRGDLGDGGGLEIDADGFSLDRERHLRVTLTCRCGDRYVFCCADQRLLRIIADGVLMTHLVLDERGTWKAEPKRVVLPG